MSRRRTHTAAKSAEHSNAEVDASPSRGRGLAEAITAGFREVLEACRPPVIVEDPLQAICRERAGYASANALPQPMDLSNPQVCKDPYMWILYFAKVNLAKGHLQSTFGTKGPLILAFEDALRKIYPSIKGEASTLNSCGLPELLCQIGMIFLNHPAVNGVEDLMLTLAPSILAAQELITEMDEKEISVSVGPAAAAAFAVAQRRLDPRRFAHVAAEAVKHAIKVSGQKREVSGTGAAHKRETDTAPGKKRHRQCRKCHAMITGSFKEHRSVCPKK